MAAVLERIGYKNGMTAGLGVMALGAVIAFYGVWGWALEPTE